MIPFAPLLLALVVGPVPQLSWVPGEPQIQTGFLIERAEQSTCAFIEIGSTSGTSWLDASAELDVSQCWQIRAFSDAGESGRSNVVCATPTAASIGDRTLTFTPTATNPGPYVVDLGAYQCKRTRGSSAYIYVLQDTVQLAKKALANPPLGVEFTMRCRETPTTVELSINGVLQLTGSR